MMETQTAALPWKPHHTVYLRFITPQMKQELAGISMSLMEGDGEVGVVYNNRFIVFKRLFLQQSHAHKRAEMWKRLHMQ